jgi:hypothetical protein
MTDFTEQLTKKLKDETNTGEWFDSHVSVIKVDFSEDVDHNALAEDGATTAIINNIYVSNICRKKPPFDPDSLEAKLSIHNGEEVGPLTVGDINTLITVLSESQSMEPTDRYDDFHYEHYTNMNQYTGTQEEFVAKVWEKVIKSLIDNSAEKTLVKVASLTPEEGINYMISELTEEK